MRVYLHKLRTSFRLMSRLQTRILGIFPYLALDIFLLKQSIKTSELNLLSSFFFWRNNYFERLHREVLQSKIFHEPGPPVPLVTPSEEASGARLVPPVITTRNLLLLTFILLLGNVPMWERGFTENMTERTERSVFSFQSPSRRRESLFYYF